jgi:hypothetical protein
MLNNILLNCRKNNGIQRIRIINKQFFSQNVWKKTKSSKKKPSETQERVEPLENKETPNLKIKCSIDTIHESGMSFADLFKKNCDFEQMKDIFDAVEYLNLASGGDMIKIRRFYVTVVLLAMHSSVDQSLKDALRKHFQLTDESRWRENPFLKVCETYLTIMNDPSARYSVTFRADENSVRYFATFKEYLLEALRRGIPDLEHWDVPAANKKVNHILELLNKLESKNKGLITKEPQKKIPQIQLMIDGLTKTKKHNLLEKSMSSEFSKAPELGAQPSLKDLLEHLAFKAAPLNQNSKSFDPERSLFDFPNSIDIPEINKSFKKSGTSEHLKKAQSHPYLDLFFDSDFQINEYQKHSNYRDSNKKIIERKPLRVEAILKIQRALGVRERSRDLFRESQGILEEMLLSKEKKLSGEELDKLEEEYEELVNLQRDPNYLLKKDTMRSNLGYTAFNNLNFYNKFKQISKL